MTLRLFDIGGSGVKTIKLAEEHVIERHDDFDSSYYENPDWDNFATWAYNSEL
ncbi:MAG: hypothetical protein GY787_19735, partial [Alteromonadales bacterium]|nr:hypothetical protein [Alteromonadales bacterium]